MSMNSLIKNAQSKIQEKDYANAFALSSEAIEHSGTKPALNLLMLHATCAQHVEKYDVSIKYFMAAFEIDKDGQFHQRIWKSLCDIYEKITDWGNHATASTRLYHILKAKGNMERAVTIAESAVESFGLAQQPEDGIKFIVEHLLESPEANALHRLKLLGQADHFRALHAEKLSSQAKVMSVGAATAKDDPVRNGSLLERDIMSGRDGPLLELALSTLASVTQEGVLNEGGGVWEDVSSLCNLVCVHLNCLLEDSVSVNLDSSVSLDKIRKEAIEVLRSFGRFTSGGIALQGVTLLTSFGGGAMSAILLATTCIVEAWFLSDHIPYATIEPFVGPVVAIMEIMQSEGLLDLPQLCVGCAVCPLTVLCMVRSAIVLNDLEVGAIKSCIRNSATVSSLWRDLIASQMAPTKGIESTIKLSSAVSTKQRAVSAYLRDIEQMLNGLCLLVCACVGAVVQYRGVAMGGITSVESLCVSQQAVTVVAAVKQLFSSRNNDGSTPVQLRGILEELAPLSRVRVLEGVCQHVGAIEEGVSRGYLVPEALDGDVVQGRMEDLSLSQKTKEKRNKDKAASELNSVTVNEDIRSNISSSVAQWVYTSLLGDLGLYGEAMAAADYFLSSTTQSVSPWLTAEKAWAFLLRAVKNEKLQVNSASHSGEIMRSFGLLRDITLPESLCCTVITALSGVLADSDDRMNEIGAEVRFRLGVAMWLAGGTLRSDKTKCIATLLSAAKLDPQMGSTYSFIGHYYKSQMNDSSRAMKCYLKALAYNPMDVEAGVSLSHLYIEGGNTSAALKLWQDVKELTASHASWCFSLEGQYYLTLGEFEMAVESFRKSLELDEADPNMWFGLGLSYFYLLQNNASLKCLQRAFDILCNAGDNPIYVLYIQAEVERRLGLLHEAMAHFEEVCNSPWSDVVSQKGLADVCLAVAYERFSMGWTQGAAHIIAKGLSVLDRIPGVASPTNADDTEVSVLVSLLKLRADMCCFVRHLSPSDITPIGSPTPADDCLGPYGAVFELLEQAESSYHRVLSLNEANSEWVDPDNLVSAWYDIGCAKYYQAVVLATAMGQGSGVSTSTILLHVHPKDGKASPQDKLQEAVIAFLSGIRASKDRDHSGCWNGIGLCIRSNDALREMCFALAAQIDATPTAFSNISLLLTLHGLDSQAKECLSALQLMEANPLHWVSLGALMEREKSTSVRGNTSPESFIPVYDSYCAALEVAKPADAWLGMALAWMRIKGLLSPEGGIIESFSAIKKHGVTDTDVKYFVQLPLTLFLHRRSVHPYAWILLGWAFGFRGKYELAVDAYNNAIRYLNMTCAHVIAMSGSALLEREECVEYSKGAIRSLLNNILSGISRCVLSSRSQGNGVHTDLAITADFATSPDRLRNVQKLLGEQAISSPQYDTVTLETKVGSLCAGNHFSECVDLIWTELSLFIDTANVPGIVRLVELSRATFLLRGMSSLYLICSRLNDSMVGAVQSHENEPDLSNTLVEVIKSSCRTVCFISRVVLSVKGTDDVLAKVHFLLKYALQYHPQSDEVVALIAVCHEPSRTQCTTQALGMSSRNLIATFDLEERFDVDQSLLCHGTHARSDPKSTCRCTEVKLREGKDIVRSYCEAVNLSVGDAIAHGVRSNAETKRMLLKSLMYDPSNSSSWNSLAAQIFSDNILGESASPISTSDETKSAPASDCPALARTGCFHGNNYLSLCAKILSSKGVQNSSVTCGENKELLLCLFSEPSDVETVDAIEKARNLFRENQYAAAIEAYRDGISTLMLSTSNDLQLGQVWKELGHAYSQTSQPQAAEYCYGVAQRHLASSNVKTNAVTQKREALWKAHCTVLSAIAYLRRYSFSKNIEDANKAKALCEECCSSSNESVQAVGSVVTAAVWNAQGKEKKCAFEVEKAMALWSAVEIYQIVVDKM